MLAIFLFVSCPLAFLGTVIGRSTATAADAPCRVNSMHRPIPDGKVGRRWIPLPPAPPLCCALFVCRLALLIVVFANFAVVHKSAGDGAVLG